MTQTNTSSILFITLLLMVGLFFFIRAATKDRTEVLTLVRQTPPQTLIQELTTYFEGRAYRVTNPEVSPTEGASQTKIELSGFVRPSVFLAIFLSFLAAVGALCFALVLGILYPRYGLAFTGLTLISPVAGWLYWQRAGREERVIFEVSPEPGADLLQQSKLVVMAHRDELLALEQALEQALAKP